MKAIKAISLVLVIVITLAVGYAIGRANTIHQAELISVNDHEYHISFGGEIHVYRPE